MNNVHLGAVARFQCEQCERAYPYRSNLMRHINDVHSAVPLYRCPRCPTTFQSSSALWQHRQRAHDPLVRFQCSACVAQLGARAAPLFNSQARCFHHIKSHHRAIGEQASTLTIRLEEDQEDYDDAADANEEDGEGGEEEEEEEEDRGDE